MIVNGSYSKYTILTHTFQHTLASLGAPYRITGTILRQGCERPGRVSWLAMYQAWKATEPNEVFKKRYIQKAIGRATSRLFHGPRGGFMGDGE